MNCSHLKVSAGAMKTPGKLQYQQQQQQQHENMLNIKVHDTQL